MTRGNPTLRVLLVTHYYWPENFRVNDLAALLVERGHAVTVLTGVPNYPQGVFYEGYGWFHRVNQNHAGVNIRRVPVIARGRATGLLLALNYLSFAVSGTLFGPWRVRSPYDVVFAFQPSPVTVGVPAIAMKWLRRVPLLLWVQDLWPQTLAATGMVRSASLLKLARVLTRAVYRRCDRILVQSEAFRQSVIAVRGDDEVAPIDYVPNWAESFYRPVEVGPEAPEAREMPDGFRVLFGGNLGSAQSLETILDAAVRLKEHRDIQWIIVGDGHRRAWLAEQRNHMGLEHSVHLLGIRPPESMPRYFALADALLVTLRGDPTFDLTVPSKVQSYLACGRPIIAALNGEGSRIVAESGAGIAVAAGDAGGLAAAVLRLKQTSHEERGRMARQAREYYERHYERNNIVSRIEELMRKSVAWRQ